MDNVLNLYKQIGETPLQTIERYVSLHPEYKGVKMTYAGRLDPMAEGVLVVLTGEKNKERDQYTGLDKDYTFEFICGVETDTFDFLGKIVETNNEDSDKNSDEKIASEKEIKNLLKKYVGEFKQKYPPFSSKVINGVPLFKLARQEKIDRIIIPEHIVKVYKLKLTGSRAVTIEELKKYIIDSIKKVEGDFRQKEIIAIWKEYLENTSNKKFLIYKVEVSCGGGFYVRQLVSDLGKGLKTGAVTISILRTRVGTYDIKKSI